MGYAADVKITMVDCTVRKIVDIQLGDMVMCDSDTPGTVTNVICGMEAELLEIKFENGYLPPLQLAPTSVVVTSAGEKQGFNLACGDALKMENGCFVTIQALDTISYNDSVYHLAFNKRAVYFADGIAVGSFEMEEEHSAPFNNDWMEQVAKEEKDNPMFWKWSIDK